MAALFNRQADGSLVAAPFEMPQRPEFFMGGGGAFSTPQDYLKLLQALVNGGSLNRVQILAPETVATMMINQIGDLRSAHPEYSNSFDQFPGQPHKWSFSFDINERPGPLQRHGTRAESDDDYGNNYLQAEAIISRLMHHYNEESGYTRP